MQFFGAGDYSFPRSSFKVPARLASRAQGHTAGMRDALAIAQRLFDGFRTPGQVWTLDTPEQSSCGKAMSFDPTLEGRKEMRLPIIVVVRLARNGSEDIKKTERSSRIYERTYTDNISRHGARVFSRFPWTVGETVRVAPRNDDCVCGIVVYCQRLADDRHAIGVNFRDHPITWSVLERYGGAQHFS